MLSLNQEMLCAFYEKYKKVNVPPENSMHQTKNFQSKENIVLRFQTSDPSTHPPYVIGKTLPWKPQTPQKDKAWSSHTKSFLVEFNEY